MTSLDELLRSRLAYAPAELDRYRARKADAIETIRAHFEAEKACLATARRDGIPTTPEAIDPAWLTEILCRGLPGAEARAVALTAGSDGSASRARLRVDWNAAGIAAELPESVFCKTSKSLEQRLMLTLAGGLRCEAGFYRDLRPYLDIETPIAYFVDVDLRTGRSIFLLDDLVSSKNATFLDPLAYIGRRHAEELVTLLARFHAPMWNSPRLDCAWLQLSRDRYREIEAMLGLEANIPRAVPLARAVLPDALVERLGELPRCYAQSLEMKSRAPITLLHGDAHIGNFYMTGRGDIGICDWQISQKGSWVHDLAYAMISALTTEDRRAWEHDLLGLYLRKLAHYGVAECPSFDEAWRFYRRDAAYCWYAWMTTIGHNENQPDMQPDHVSLAIIERAAIAILDLRSLDAFD